MHQTVRCKSLDFAGAQTQQLLRVRYSAFTHWRHDGVRACTACPPLLITSKQKGAWSLSCWLLLISIVTY